MDKGAVVVGEARIGLADVDLMYLGLQLVLGSIDRFEPTGGAFLPGGGHAGTPSPHTPVGPGGEPQPRGVTAGKAVPSPTAVGEGGVRAAPSPGGGVPGFQDLAPTED